MNKDWVTFEYEDEEDEHDIRDTRHKWEKFEIDGMDAKSTNLKMELSLAGENEKNIPSTNITGIPIPLLQTYLLIIIILIHMK